MVAEFVRLTPGHAPGSYLLNGMLTFATATDALIKVEPLFGQPRLCLDLSGVTRADSAGAGLLVEWLRRARARGCQLRYAHLPEALVAMLRVGGIEGMLPVDMPPAVPQPIATE